ncbi:MAG: acetylornithine transaminase [Armatimonadota bacterium]
MSQYQPLASDVVMKMDNDYVMHTYGRLPIVLTRGEGARVYDADGNCYLDFVAGIAVNALGHCHPKVVEAIREQAGKLIHTSNLYYTQPQAELAKLLVEASDMKKAFFCNSGAEANEAAFKLARKAAKKNGQEKKTAIVAAEQSFHGRTFAAITATGQPKYQKSFLPLVPGFTYIPFNDSDALKDHINDDTCAVILEPVQGESGVHPANKEFLLTARELCTKFNAALIFDEVQTGLGRTGKLFAYQHFDVIPDIMTLAKALGAGFPMGACLACGEYADTFEPGDHASTFGGTPLACTAGIAAVNEIINNNWVENADKIGRYLRERLSELPDIKEIRGLGLMCAVDFNNTNSRDLAKKAMSKGLLMNPIGESTLRMVPPLIINESDVDEAINILLDCF